LRGFVAGDWVALSQDRGTSIVVVDSEDSARMLVGMVESAPPMSVTVESVEFGEVMAHA